MEVWKATYDDLDTLVTLAREFHDQSPFKNFPFSPSGSKSHFIRMMNDPFAVVFMHEDGLIGGSVGDYPFCDMCMAKEMFWFARNEGEGGLSLLQAYMTWIEGKGAQTDVMTVLCDDMGRKPGAIIRFMKRLGYEPIETTLMRVT
jgi:hypothetical protein